MGELLPCPFCGGEAELTGFDAPEFWVWCPNCKASTDAHTGKQSAIAAWNTRAERTCHMFPSDYYPCAEDECMRLKVRMWTCSVCEADHVGSKPNYCPNCGARAVSE